MKSKVYSPREEPVRLAASIQGLLSALLGLSVVFGWWHPTDAQVAAIFVVYGAVVRIIGDVIREQVVPVAKLIRRD